MKSLFLILTATVLLSACASHRPVIYPNTHSQTVGPAQVEADVQACKQLAENAGANANSSKASEAAERTVRGGGIGAATGAVGGAIAGNAGRGAAVGAASGATASLIHALLGDSRPNPAYRNFVTRCLQDRGYELSGWN